MVRNGKARPRKVTLAAGTVEVQSPRVNDRRVDASGGRIRYGPLRPDVNRYLKWAFIEAANGVCRNRRRHPHRHVSRLYDRLLRHKGHPKVAGAVARAFRDG